MQTGPGSRYDAELEGVLRKHKIGRALVFVHQPNTPVEKYEKLLIGNTNHEWELLALEGFIETCQALLAKGELLTAKPKMPDPLPEDVKNG